MLLSFLSDDLPEGQV